MNQLFYINFCCLDFVTEMYQKLRPPALTLLFYSLQFLYKTTWRMQNAVIISLFFIFSKSVTNNFFSYSKDYNDFFIFDF